MKDAVSRFSRGNPMLRGFHHAAIICRDYDAAMDFYVNKLGLRLFRETYNEKQDKRKLELWLEEKYLLEVFIVPGRRESEKKAELRAGLDHLSFLVEDVPAAAARLREMGVGTTEVMHDNMTGKQYVFFFDPDGQKLELYQE
ncbi:hypothetical protein SDC9_68942 [bioreactor metagenome]|uniref:VOC domain-containing protein n=1 Tax=bioreactor metagenome TaxID=1076179 RepID=A0A644Y2W3_9ZZZZ